MYPKYRLLQGVSLFFESYSPARHYVCALGEPSSARSAVFLNPCSKNMLQILYDLKGLLAT